MILKMHAGNLIHHISLVIERICQKLLKNEPKALCRSEQIKILSVLWNNPEGSATYTDLSIRTGLANNTLTSMIKKMEEQGLVCLKHCPKDKRKRYVNLTELGWAQKEIGEKIYQELGETFYSGFSKEEIIQVEDYLNRILQNLKKNEVLK